MERTPDPTRTRQVIGARYPTWLSAIVLISRRTVHSILTLPFSLLAQSSRCQSSENCCPINSLVTTRHIPLKKPKILRAYWINPIRTRPWSQLTYPTWHIFSLFVPLVMLVTRPYLYHEKFSICLLNLYSPEPDLHKNILPLDHLGWNMIDTSR